MLSEFVSDEVRFHAVRSREAGHRSFLSMHVLVPGSWTVRRGHDLVEDIEERLRAAVDHLEVSAHIEPIEDPRSYEESLGIQAPGE